MVTLVNFGIIFAFITTLFGNLHTFEAATASQRKYQQIPVNYHPWVPYTPFYFPGSYNTSRRKRQSPPQRTIGHVDSWWGNPYAQPKSQQTTPQPAKPAGKEVAISWSSPQTSVFSEEFFSSEPATHNARRKEYEKNSDLVDIAPLPVPSTLPNGTSMAGVNPLSIKDTFEEMEDVMKREIFDAGLHDEIMIPRADGLSAFGVLYINSHTLQAVYRPPKEDSLATSNATTNGVLSLLAGKKSFVADIGAGDFTRFMAALTNLCFSHWTKVKSVIVKEPQHAKSVATNGLQLNIIVRSELICPFVQNIKSHEIYTNRIARMLIVKLQPFILAPRKAVSSSEVIGYPMKPVGWHPLCLVGTVPLFRQYITQDPVDLASLRVLQHWAIPFNKNYRLPVFKRSLAYGEPSHPPHNLLGDKMWDDENKYLNFRCSQSALYTHSDKRNGGIRGTCVVLPIEADRLFSAERAMIQCNDVYPVGTQVLTVHDSMHSHRYTKNFYWRFCSLDKGWTSPIAVSPIQARNYLKKCKEQNDVETTALEGTTSWAWDERNLWDPESIPSETRKTTTTIGTQTEHGKTPVLFRREYYIRRKSYGDLSSLVS